MRKALAIIGIVAAIPLLVLTVLLGRSFVLQVMGYPVDVPPSELAARIAAENGDPLLCRKLQQTVPTLGPSLTEKRMLCFYLLAQETKDPSACELLMPGSYGWDCVGAAQDKQPCLFDFKDPPEVRGNGIIAPMSQCLDGSATVRNNTCCAIARIAFLGEQGDCSSLGATQDFKDQCHHEVALKRKESVFCDAIQNDNIKSACQVQIRALQAR